MFTSCLDRCSFNPTTTRKDERRSDILQTRLSAARWQSSAQLHLRGVVWFQPPSFNRLQRFLFHSHNYSARIFLGVILPEASLYSPHCSFSRFITSARSYLQVCSFSSWLLIHQTSQRRVAPLSNLSSEKRKNSRHRYKMPKPSMKDLPYDSPIPTILVAHNLYHPPSWSPQAYKRNQLPPRPSPAPTATSYQIRCLEAGCTDRISILQSLALYRQERCVVGTGDLLDGFGAHDLTS